MNITHELLNKVNSIQTNIFAEVIRVCAELNIRFFLIHGSLLGAVRCNGFIPLDDDIDIAMFREDYELFIRKAHELIHEDFFVQTHLSDPHYPLPFAKVRHNHTTYIVESARNIPMHHGIYIDVFPIDYSLDRKWKKYLLKVLNVRIGCSFASNTISAAKHIRQLISKLLFPSATNAILLRDKIFLSSKKSNYIAITGGKASETHIPLKWFKNSSPSLFETLPVFIPSEYDHYLKHIYGDYINTTLVEDKYSDNSLIEINACIVDPEKSYINYL